MRTLSPSHPRNPFPTPDRRHLAAVAAPTAVPQPPRIAVSGGTDFDPKGVGWGVWRTCRARQWLKNVLVFAAPAAAGVLTQPVRLAHAVLAAVILCAASSAGYFLNDARDAAADSLHPSKRHRPIAAGVIRLPAAWATAAVLAVGAVTVATAWLGPHTAFAVAAYLVLTAAYSLHLKQIPVLELLTVAVGFALRTVIGALATHVPVSPWFLIVTASGALFMIAGKRSAELQELHDEAARAHRPVLAAYTLPYLAHLRTLAATSALIAYCLWALTLHAAGTANALAGARHGGTVLLQLSILPVLAGLLRYSLHLHHGHGARPEDLVLSDRFLQGCAATWLLLFTAGIYV
ncbi:decaprenyl-phosphate phosphoribosyltransferase [Streptomyces sp. NPDC047028]|uniref:decaprenyl-phosphate phosphoribosyltransferase n=1 Tax=Streptomyces sp. NPDC047028 TaxID=3155793 RepID=UPI0033C096E7